MRWTVPLVAGLVLSPTSAAADLPPVRTDEQAIKEAGLPTDGPGLVQYFRRRALQDVPAEKIKGLIRQLGDDDFDARENASDALIGLGQRAAPFLLNARASLDAEVVRRAEACLQQIKGGVGNGVETAAVRMLAIRKPAEAAEALLAFLSVVESNAMADEVADALASMMRREGRPDKAVVAALGNKMSLRRAIAAVALCRAGLQAKEPAVQKAVQDVDWSVRQRAALALAAAGDKSAVSVLIDLLPRLPQEGAWEVEDCLLRLADGPGPGLPLRFDADSRKKCRDAWAHWWAANEGKADLGKLKTSLEGITLVVLSDQKIVREVDAAGKTLWEVKEIGFPLDAQALPGDRVLVAEHANHCVTERDRLGKIVWKVDTKDLSQQLAKQAGIAKVQEVVQPLVAQRLSNGNTFIATGNQMFEVDKDGKLVWPRSQATFGIMVRGICKAQRLRNGDIAYISGTNQFVRLGRDGKERLSFSVGATTSGGRLDMLANGHVVVPQVNQGRVVEYDSEGRPVWQATVEQPIAAVRLPNGHTLVTTMNQNRAVELDRGGRIVWDYRSNGRVNRAFRR